MDTQYINVHIIAAKRGSMAVTSSSLVVLSNRLPFTLQRGEDGGIRRVAAAGGLVTAVAPVVVQSKGNKSRGKQYIGVVPYRVLTPV